MRWRVTFQAMSTARSATGLSTPVPVDFCLRSAEVLTSARAERIIGSQEISEGAIVLHVRSDSTTRQIDSSYRAVISDGRILDIVSVVDPDGRRSELMIVCRHRADA